MWLLTAVGPVHGQIKFTFALEQRKTYTVGRDKTCDIRFESRHVKPLQGSIIVGVWDPTNPTQCPELRWKSEPSKRGVFPSFNTLLPSKIEDVGSTERDSYDVDEIPEGTNGCLLHDHARMGIDLAEGCWFTTTWKPFQLCYDKMKDESDEARYTLRQFCISYTQQFEPETPPNIVLSTTYRASTDCNYAVCFGVRILVPAYLQAILMRLSSCWKKVADSQDSFMLPDQEEQAFQPELDSALPNVRSSVECWVPDQGRKTLFSDWRIMGLRAKTFPGEKRWLMAMGANYTDIDIVSKPPASSKDVDLLLKPWLDEVDQDGSRDHALVVHFLRVKEDLTKKGVDFNNVIGGTCQRLRLIVASGNVCWGAVRKGGVMNYIEDLAGAVPVKPPVATRARQQIHAAPEPSLPVPSQPTQIPLSSAVQSTQQPPFIPSTFPDEAEGSSKSVPKEKVPEEDLPPASQPTKKPPRKRAAKKIDLFGEDFSVIPESMDIDSAQIPPLMTLPKTQATYVAESQVPETESQSLTGASKSRLKRRANRTVETQQPSQFNFGFDESFDTDHKSEQMAAEIRELYEQTKAEQASVPGRPTKRQRVVFADTTSRGSDSRGSSVQKGDAGMDVEGDEMVEEVEDPIQRQLRKAREARTQASAPPSNSKGDSMPMPAARQPTRRAKSPTEEPEQVEEVQNRKETKNVATKKTTASQAENGDQEPTKDDAFLQAISKASKTKKATDELDRDFNQLQIHKPGQPGKMTTAKSPTWQDHPDWNLVEGFDDDVRGNFIQIIKKDLFRKDLGKSKEQAVVDDGRPSFKKFKKKIIMRKEPMRMVLAGQTINDAEMGEPYWPTESAKSTKRSQAISQISASMAEDEDEMPLLPRSKKRLVGSRIDDSPPLEDDPTPALAGVPTRPTQKKTTLTRTGPAARKTRAASIVSDASSAPPTRSRSTRTKSTTKPTGKRQRKAEPVVLEDSEEEVAEEMDKTPLPPASTTSRATEKSGTSGRGATSTLEPPESRPTRSTGTGKTTQITTVGRRKLLPADDDDDDGMVFKGLQKKRRLG